MSNLGISLPSQRRDGAGHIVTHGFVHGHVHQHKDHVHIHGHIHNHDHLEHGHDHGAPIDGPHNAASGQHMLSDLECKELENSFDLCDDIFCDELDDCYYDGCDNPETAHREEYAADPAACCDDKACLVEASDHVCAEPSCLEADHHDNSLCEWQKPRLMIFEDLIQNVHRNIEKYGALELSANSGSVHPDNFIKSEDTIDSGNAGNFNISGGNTQYNSLGARSGVALDPSQFHIHFPHHCHQDTHGASDESPGESTDLIEPPGSKSSLDPANLAASVKRESPSPSDSTNVASSALLSNPTVSTSGSSNSEKVANAAKPTESGPNSHRPNGSHRMHQSCFHARLPITAPGRNLLTGHVNGQDPAYLNPAKQQAQQVQQPSQGSKPQEQETQGSLQSSQTQRNEQYAQDQKNQQEQRAQQDFDFFVQFNNFKQVYPTQDTKVSEIRDPHATLGHSHLNPQHTFSCQWENCLQPVDNESLVSHLLGSHLGQQSHAQGDGLGLGQDSAGDMGPLKLECEWDDCGFVDANMQSFLDHLITHKTNEVSLKQAGSPLLTPSSIDAVSDSPPRVSPPGSEGLHMHGGAHSHTHHLPHSSTGLDPGQCHHSGHPTHLSHSNHLSHPNHLSHSNCHHLNHSNLPNQGNCNHSNHLNLPNQGNCNHSNHLNLPNHANCHHSKQAPKIEPHRHELSISGMRIFPQKKVSCDPPDPHHVCKWQVGTDDNGEPIMCNRVHATDGLLQEHLKNDHIGRGKSSYQCCWVGCERNHGKPFTQRQKVFRHIHIHTGYKPCVCEECGAHFAVPSMLKQHQRIHSGEKPYKCDTCARCFATSSSLAIHKRLHTDSRPLVCPWPGCGRRFRENSNFGKHVRMHSQTFQCTECGKEFDSRRSFTRHVKTHGKKSKSALPYESMLQV